jgi:hypothetical protein
VLGLGGAALPGRGGRGAQCSLCAVSSHSMR